MNSSFKSNLTWSNCSIFGQELPTHVFHHVYEEIPNIYIYVYGGKYVTNTALSVSPKTSIFSEIIAFFVSLVEISCLDFLVGISLFSFLFPTMANQSLSLSLREDVVYIHLLEPWAEIGAPPLPLSARRGHLETFQLLNCIMHPLERTRGSLCGRVHDVLVVCLCNDLWNQWNGEG